MTRNRFLILSLMLLSLAGCGLLSPEANVTPQDRQKTGRFIALFEEELQTLDKLTSKSVGPLINEVLTIAKDGSRGVSPNDLLKSTRNQVETVRQVLDAKEIPNRLPRVIREELLAAKDAVRRAYHIKLESLDRLEHFLKDGKPHWIIEYRRLADEATQKLAEAEVALKRAKHAAGLPN